MLCPICNQESTNGISLADGRVLHRACLIIKQNQKNEIHSQIALESNRLKKLEKKLAIGQGLLSQVKKFFLGKPSNASEIKNEIEELVNQLADLRGEEEIIIALLQSIYEIYLSYPPDWEERRDFIRKRDQVCKQCRSNRYLHVHHVISLGKGGTNRLDNLILLCDRCHKKRHKVSDFKYSSGDHKTAFSKRLSLINEAIRSGKEIEFLYKKPEDKSFRKRTVKPSELKNAAHRDGINSTLCVRGYCYLRKAERVFALKRMKGLKIR